MRRAVWEKFEDRLFESLSANFPANDVYLSSPPAGRGERGSCEPDDRDVQLRGAIGLQPSTIPRTALRTTGEDAERGEAGEAVKE
jgi:hypothetical protein